MDFYRWLIHWRRSHPVLWDGGRKTVHVDVEQNTYGYIRYNDEETILITLNVSDKPHTIRVYDQEISLGAWEGDMRLLSS